MNWNDAAEDFLNQVLGQTPYPVRDQTEANLRRLSEAMAEEEGKNRVGVETVIAAWVRLTPEALRASAVVSPVGPAPITTVSVVQPKSIAPRSPGVFHICCVPFWPSGTGSR